MALTLAAISGRSWPCQVEPPSWVPNTWPLRVQKYTCSGARSFTAMPKVVLVGSMPWSNLLQLSPPSVERRMPPSSLPKFKPTQA